MSFQSTADSQLDDVNGFDASEYIADFDDLYTEEEFASLGVDPIEPTGAKPGSEAKVLMLAARYAAGLPLWHDEDCYDHGPERISDGEDGFGDDELDELD